jgi:NRPS condensation-like uncharacterized protein
MAKKKSSTRQIPEGKAQVNFNIPTGQFEKIKAIAGIHGLNQSDVFNQAVDKFIELYEKKNGPVQPGPKKKEIKL